ncbi:MAG: DoxX family membrane protein [Gemmatimonadota bacterium]
MSEPMSAGSPASGPVAADSGRSLAILFARLTLGLMFFMAGVYKVFEQGAVEHARELFIPFADTFLPEWSLWALGTVIPFVELSAGLLLLLGFKTRWALVAAGMVLLTATFGHLMDDVYFLLFRHVLPRLALLLFLLVLPAQLDRFSVDGWLRR